MKDKNLPDDIKNKSLNELTELANNIIENLEINKDLESSISEYQNLITLNNLIEKKFRNTSKEISQMTQEKINKLFKKKNEKKNK
jgi:exonuclease VII small subunit